MRKEIPKRITSKEDPRNLRQNFTAQQIKEGIIDKFAEQLKIKYKQTYPNIEGPIEVAYRRRQNQTVTIPNPLDGIASGKDAFILNTKKPQYYLRFGFLLSYIKENVLPRVKIGSDHDENPPIFDIDDDTFSNHMFSLPNQISLDPRVCIVRNDSFYVGTSTPTQVYSNLYLFREKDNGTSANENAAYPMNIYLNFNFIIESLATDERGDVNTFEFLKSICDGLNKALGGINNLEPIIDETSNILRIVDTTPIPGYSTNPSQKYILQLYGYNSDFKVKGSSFSTSVNVSYTSNFVRKVDLKTAITPEFATMITVGATAGGYVKGVEATAFSKWNVGLTDRFKDEFEPGNIASVKPVGGVDEAESNYGEKIIIDGVVKRYGLTNFTPGSMELSDDIIEGNISIGTEYFKYLIAKNKNSSGGTIGFIPFKISFTMDGLSGIKIYNKLNVDTRFLPKAYGDNLDLIVTGVSHKLANNDWETDIEATVIPKSSAISTLGISSAFIEQSIENSISPSTNPTLGFSSGPCGTNITKDDWIWPYRAWGWGAGGAAELYNLYFSTGRTRYFSAVKNGFGWQNWPAHHKSPRGYYPDRGGDVSCNGYDAISWYKTFPDKTKHKELAIAFVEVWLPRLRQKLTNGLAKVNGTGKNGSGVSYSKIKVALQKASQLSGIKYELLVVMMMAENGGETCTLKTSQYQGPFQMNKDYYPELPNYRTSITPASGTYKDKSCYDYFISNQNSDGSNDFINFAAQRIAKNYRTFKSYIR
jgi:hypothetical protein